MTDEIEDRIFRAYFRRFGKYAYMPSGSIEYIEIEGNAYAVLSNVNGILAVYRINNDGSLRFIDKVWFENAT